MAPQSYYQAILPPPLPNLMDHSDQSMAFFIIIIISLNIVAFRLRTFSRSIKNRFFPSFYAKFKLISFFTLCFKWLIII